MIFTLLTAADRGTNNLIR